jgi:hypothetical protein
VKRPCHFAHRPGARRLCISRLAATLCFGAFVGLAACAQRSEGDSPERAAQEFIDRMQRVHGDVQKSKAAYELLASEAQANLVERAQRASATIGRVVAPEEMLAPSRFYLSFPPRSWSTERGAGWAIVTAEGEAPHERHQIRCVLENGRWKVVVDLPELPPIERRASEAPH